MSAKEIGRRFSRLAFKAAESPGAVDRNDLLIAADALLTLIGDDDTTRDILARQMAFQACNWAVFGGPVYYDRLLRAIRLFGMHAELTTH